MMENPYEVKRDTGLYCKECNDLGRRTQLLKLDYMLFCPFHDREQLHDKVAEVTNLKAGEAEK